LSVLPLSTRKYVKLFRRVFFTHVIVKVPFLFCTVVYCFSAESLRLRLRQTSRVSLSNAVESIKLKMRSDRVMKNVSPDCKVMIGMRVKCLCKAVEICASEIASICSRYERQERLWR
jgi:hypothetical protein